MTLGLLPSSRTVHEALKHQVRFVNAAKQSAVTGSDTFYLRLHTCSHFHTSVPTNPTLAVADAGERQVQRQVRRMGTSAVRAWKRGPFGRRIKWHMASHLNWTRGAPIGLSEAHGEGETAAIPRPHTQHNCCAAH